MRYTVILEHGESGWGVHVPDLPGCIAAGEDRNDAIDLIREAIEFHIEGLKREGLSNPEARSESVVVEIGVT
jgi:predicted RNase H-like HicB family nuclease